MNEGDVMFSSSIYSRSHLQLSRFYSYAIMIMQDFHGLRSSRNPLKEIILRLQYHPLLHEIQEYVRHIDIFNILFNKQLIH